MSYQQEKFREIADKIREKTGTEDAIKPSDFADKLTEVFDAGSEAEKRNRWDKHISSLSATAFTYAFAGKGWNDDSFTPYTDIIPLDSKGCSGMFSYCGITDLKGILEQYGTKIDISKTLNVSNMFSYALVTRVPEITLNKVSAITSMFSNATSLVSIDCLTFPSDATTANAFSNCTSLVEIRIGGVIGKSIDFGSCPLNRASVESIVAALSDNVTGQTVTFKNSQIELINGATSWWADLVASKPNWTFALLDV